MIKELFGLWSQVLKFYLDSFLVNVEGCLRIESAGVRGRMLQTTVVYELRMKPNTKSLWRLRNQAEEKDNFSGDIVHWCAKTF